MAAHSKKMENEVSGWKQSGIFFYCFIEKTRGVPGEHPCETHENDQKVLSAKTRT